MREKKFSTNFKDLRRTIDINTISSAVVASIFGGTGPALIVIGGATNGGLTYAQTISWLFAVYFFSGYSVIYFGIKISSTIRVPIPLQELY